jgi:NADPH:quinone reductase
MKGIVVTRYGEPEVLAFVDVPDVIPGPGEVLVRNSYAGISYGDIYIRNGTYRPGQTYGKKPPFVLGLEGGGTVEKLGLGVRGIKTGDRVAYCLSGGSYAQYTAVSASRLVKVPVALSLREAVAALLHGCTAHYLINSIVRLNAGDSCLIHAGAGSTGRLLIQMAKQRKLRVFTTVGSPQKEGIVKALGADTAIQYRITDFQQVIQQETGGEGVDIAFDSVGRDTIERSIRSIRTRGTCVLFGASSGTVDSISPTTLAEAGSVYFIRPHLAHFLQTGRELRRRATAVFTALNRGQIQVSVDRELDLSEAATAHSLIEARSTSGKVLLKVAGG